MAKNRTYMKQVNFVFYVYDANITISGDECNSIIFLNKGASNVIINSVTLTTDQSLSLDCNHDERDKSRYTISFSGAGTQICNVFKKFNQR